MLINFDRCGILITIRTKIILCRLARLIRRSKLKSVKTLKKYGKNNTIHNGSWRYVPCQGNSTGKENLWVPEYAPYYIILLIAIYTIYTGKWQAQAKASQPAGFCKPDAPPNKSFRLLLSSVFIKIIYTLCACQPAVGKM